MVTKMTNKTVYIFTTILIVNACIAGTIPATPENITVTFLTPTTVRVAWQTMIDLNAHPIEKYIVTYKPTDDRVVQDVAGNSEAVILDRLSPNTQYSIAVTAVWLGKKYRSRQIVFKTLDLPKNSTQQDLAAGSYRGNTNAGSSLTGGRLGNTSVYADDVTSTATNTLSRGTHRELPTIRGVEIGIVLIVLMVWAGAIALFFNRWGKIRMLLPYQPDYKHEQLKVPGTGVCTGGACTGQHSHQFGSSDCGALAYQPLHCSSRHFHMLQEEQSTAIAERCTRSRINSAIFVSSEGRGFDSIEFLRRHGSQSVLCRKARSAENITEDERKKSFSEKRQWQTEEGEQRNEARNRNDVGIELKECVPSGAFSVLKTNAEQLAATVLGAGGLLGHSAAVTTSNVVVGSISIEAPPAHLKDEETNPTIIGGNSSSHDSNDTVEELIQIPIETKPRAVLIHQRSSTTSCSPQGSPKALSLKGLKSRVGTLPMVSVSGPSPQHENPPQSEYL